MAKVELLAPAGNCESFDVAIASEADAIYLGLDDFNARKSAENFTKENISEIVQRAHLRGVKVYLTLNTIVQDSEYPQLYETIETAIKANIDAFIVQDFGVLYILRNKYSLGNIEIHASTQMGIHNLQGARVAKRLGISRIVLARETTKEDIIEIKKNVDIDLEFFVQGALCVCFSGNCYMSYFDNGKSGNRGECKQLCRYAYYSPETNKTEYYLSAKDICLANSLNELISLGITSFKIEGRLRRWEYIQETVAIYRKLIDTKKPPSKEDIERIKIAYNRGEYSKRLYLDNPNANSIYQECNNHIGLQIGKVIQVSKQKNIYRVSIQSNREIKEGDGLKFLSNKKEVASVGVGNVDNKNNIYTIYTKHAVKPGNDVSLISTVLQKKQLNKRNITWRIQEGTVQVKENNTTVQVSFKKTNTYISDKEAKKILYNVYNTDFNTASVSTETPEIPISKEDLERVRYKALEELNNQIIKKYNKQLVVKELPSIAGNNTVRDLKIYEIDEIDALEEDTIIQLRDYTQKNMDKLQSLNINNKVILQLPTIATKEDIQVIQRAITSSGITKIITPNIYGIDIDVPTKYADWRLNCASSYATKQLEELGVTAVQASPEYSPNSWQIERIRISNPKPLMTLRSKMSVEHLQNKNTQYKIKETKIKNSYYEIYRDTSDVN